ncbi:MAG: hypothetical protein A3J46_01175 [Candidatus Yanofskybacteria bacterium RIFCSPHIGHO2_02_FULL_41_11]|uniref:D-3-phosphoglycerate dehydrogenase n=1 Tax=Candidatus Yanofskybacteria bacterium RIFCSPHIGHO2_02_FULL_41_11 TaxID=1802675 RepID=A0A1F8FAW9_9BACT|nr:MAG: hypothetical protein A3J46_01175 [Candidatus Yanofskybacteria bacterium RIFCSPHIGHO2_02_FULL_41_11]
MKTTILGDNINEHLLAEIIPNLQIIPMDQEPEMIFVRSADLKQIQLPASLIAICRAGAGVNNIPVDWCSQHGIVVFNSPGANATSVRELVIWAIITSCRNLIPAVRFVEQKLAEFPDNPVPEEFWEKSKQKFVGMEISGKRILVIGLGAVGRLVAQSCHNLGMSVYSYDPYAQAEEGTRCVTRIDSLNNIPECEFVSVNASLTEETKGLLGENFFKQCKPGLRLINCARAAIVDSRSLGIALETGIVQTYISDAVNAQLAVAFPERVIPLPHIGASTAEAEIRAITMVAEQLYLFYTTGQITNSINFPSCSLERRKANHARLLVSNINMPGMIAKITGLLGDSGLNISGMTNKGREQVGYNIIDIESPDGHVRDLAEKIKKINGITSVRLIKVWL